MTSDWLDACDPVPPRQEVELTDAQRAKRLRKWKRRFYAPLHLGKDAVDCHAVEAGFDEMEG